MESAIWIPTMGGGGCSQSASLVPSSAPNLPGAAGGFSTPLEVENQSLSDRPQEVPTMVLPRGQNCQGGVLRPGRGLGGNLALENFLIHNAK